MIVGFTGTRRGMNQWQKNLLRGHLKRLGVTAFLHGACVGADEEATEIARNLGFWIEAYPGDNPEYVSAQALLLSDVNYEPHPNLERNDIIVERCDLLIAAPLTEVELHRGSGTWYTIRQARKLGKDYLTLHRDGSTYDSRGS